MAALTILQLKAWIGHLPAELDTALVEWPEGPLVLFTDTYTAKNGGVFRTVVAHLDLATGLVEQLPYVKQDYSKLFLTDGTVNPAAFNADGTIKPGATSAVAVVG